ncbi:hypothetical protein AgCh_004889 [Apium graveolens]
MGFKLILLLGFSEYKLGHIFMDRNWVRADRMSAQYKKGVIDFCEYAAKNAKDSRFILCPCRNCLNVITVEGIDILKEHLLCDEIDKTYTCWTYHGEKKGERSSTNINSHYQFEDIMDTNIFGGAEGSTSGDKNDIPTMFNKELRDHPDMH